MLKTLYPHVIISNNGIPVVGIAQIPVAQIALEVGNLGFTPQEVQLFVHRQLSLGEIYSAMSFFYDKYFDLRPTVLDRIEQLRGP